MNLSCFFKFDGSTIFAITQELLPPFLLRSYNNTKLL